MSGPYVLSRPVRAQRSSGCAIGRSTSCAAGGVHLLADDLLDGGEDPAAQRQPRVDAARDAPDVAGAQEQPVAVDVGVGGVVAERAQEQDRHPHPGEASCGLRRRYARNRYTGLISASATAVLADHALDGHAAPTSMPGIDRRPKNTTLIVPVASTSAHSSAGLPAIGLIRTECTRPATRRVLPERRRADRVAAVERRDRHRSATAIAGSVAVAVAVGVDA